MIYHLMIVIIQVYWVPDQCHLWGEGQDELEWWWGKEEADKGKKRENWRHSKKEGRTPTALGIGLPLFQSGVCLYVLFNFFDKNSWSFFLTWRYCIVMSGVKEATRSTLLSLPAGLQDVRIQVRDRLVNSLRLDLSKMWNKFHSKLVYGLPLTRNQVKGVWFRILSTQRNIFMIKVLYL